MKKKIINILNKRFNKPITCLTAYSPSIAKILDGNVDLILIGDSLGTTLYGMRNTRGVTLNMMKLHGLAVTKNINKSITVIDMPYKTYSNKIQAKKNAISLLNYTNAKMIKIEINEKNLPIAKYLAEKKINFVAHIGVTPQSFVDFKKIRAVGKKKIESEKLINLALNAEKAGANMLLLECVTWETSKKITSVVSIPTIGIGSSKFCDGQVLVFDDLINFDQSNYVPRFVKKYMNFQKQAKIAIKKFSRDVKEKKFPGKKNSY